MLPIYYFLVGGQLLRVVEKELIAERIMGSLANVETGLTAIPLEASGGN